MTKNKTPSISTGNVPRGHTDGAVVLVRRAWSNFVVRTVISIAYICCTLAIQQQQIQTLSVVIADLSSGLEALKENENGSHTSNEDHSSYVQVASQSTPNQVLPNQPVKSAASAPRSKYDRKFNLVFFGIEENPNGIYFIKHLLQDHKAIVSTLKSLANVSICDSTRLGKYNSSLTRPKHIIVKFNGANYVSNILSKRSKLAQLAPLFRLSLI